MPYKAQVVCNNCGYVGEISIPLGELITSQLCPNCSCRSLKRDKGFAEAEIKSE